MRALLVTLGLAALAGAARAEPPLAACETFRHASPDAPPMVRDWLAHSGDDHVIVCPRAATAGETTPPEPLYAGESAPARHGAVCRYSHHGLTRLGHGAASHLQHYEASEAIEMTLAESSCPPAHPAGELSHYIETYDVSPAAFVAIVQLWAAAAASATAFDRALCCEAHDAGDTPAPASAAARAHLRAAIDAGRMRGAPVIRIVRISGRTLRHRFALIVTQPDSAAATPSLYVIYLSKPVIGDWHITGVAEAAG